MVSMQKYQRQLDLMKVQRVINVGTMKQELADDRLTRNRLKEEEDEIESNPYDMVILNTITILSVSTFL